MNGLKLIAIATSLMAAMMLAANPSAQQTRDAASAPTRAQASAKSAAESAAAPVYRPPIRSAPGGRVSGATRGADRAVFLLSVLAPDHTGLTTGDQPALYWFMSNKASSPVEVTLVDPRTTKALLEVRLAPPVEPGVHAIRLADHNVRLERGVVYRWYVAVVSDEKRRSRDVLTGGAIERVDAPDALRAKLAHADKHDMPAIYAESGLWYDAIAAVSSLIESAPGNSAWRAQRAAMLAQVGLPQISE